MKMATQFQAMMWFHNTTFFTKLTTSPTEYTIKFQLKRYKNMMPEFKNFFEFNPLPATCFLSASLN